MRFEKRLTLDVVLPREPAGMPGGTVSLHNESLFRPTEVGDDPATSKQQRNVDVGLGKSPADD